MFGEKLSVLVLEGPEGVFKSSVVKVLAPELCALDVAHAAGRFPSDEAQALCFIAGANSVFLGDRLLTTPNPGATHDEQLFDKLRQRFDRSREVLRQRLQRTLGPLAQQRTVDADRLQRLSDEAYAALYEGDQAALPAVRHLTIRSGV